jgi:ABC-type multidrug transport system fused ATPase/permease subunit
LFLLAGAAMALLGPVGSFAAKVLIDGVVAHDLAHTLFASVISAAVAALALLNGMYYIDWFFAVLEKASAAINRALMGLLGGTPGIAHHELPQYLQELELLQERRHSLAGMTNATVGMVRIAVQLVASGVLLARLDPVLLALPLVGIGSFLAGRKAQRLKQVAEEACVATERQRRHLYEVATSASLGKEVRLFGLRDELLRRHHRAAGTVMTIRNRADWQSAGFEALGTLLFGLAYAGSVALVLVRAVDGLATPGDVVLAIGLVAGLNNVVSMAVGYGTFFLGVLRVADRYLWLLDYAAANQASPAEPAPVPDRLDRGIDLSDLTFRYPGSAATVLQQVSLHLPAGGVVALVGENGAGKTTLAKVLCRFYEPDGGQILVDGIDLRRLPVDAWRARLSAAFQDFARFEFLVRETVGVGDLPRIEQSAVISEALARAGAGDVLATLPERLETQLGKAWKGGVEFSGGQWQKLALGRAMLREQPLLVIFDEPTAALDAPTEHALFERFAAAARGSQLAGTVTVLVSHRFSTVRMADLIVVLEHGQVVEQGSHADLMARNGTYAALYRLQSQAYQ